MSCRVADFCHIQVFNFCLLNNSLSPFFSVFRPRTMWLNQLYQTWLIFFSFFIKINTNKYIFFFLNSLLTGSSLQLNHLSLYSHLFSQSWLFSVASLTCEVLAGNSCNSPLMALSFHFFLFLLLLSFSLGSMESDDGESWSSWKHEWREKQCKPPQFYLLFFRKHHLFSLAFLQKKKKTFMAPHSRAPFFFFFWFPGKEKLLLVMLMISWYDNTGSLSLLKNN